MRNGVFCKSFNNYLVRDYPLGDIYKSKGLLIHIRNRGHDKVREIIDCPDFIGHDARHLNSFELIKVYDDNIQVAIKLDIENGYWYVSSIYEITQAKL